MSTIEPPWPPKGLARPAKRALASHGIATLEQLAACTEPQIATLHGMGPKGLRILRESLAEAGLAFAR